MPTTLRDVTRTARKKHWCEMCNGPIEVGDRHRVSTNVWDGRVYDFRECAACTNDRITSEVYAWCAHPDEGVCDEDAREWAHEHRGDPALGRSARAWLTRRGCTCEACEDAAAVPVGTDTRSTEGGDT